jgi:SpoVK/Ycf46/Vps4 family AAA+-type ATPase
MAKRNDSDSRHSRGITSQLLIDLQGSHGICMVGATNTPWLIDSAFIRRFDRAFYIALPNKKARMTLFQKILNTIPNTLLRVDIQRLAEKTEGFSSDDIQRVCKNASGRKTQKLRTAQYFAQTMKGDWFPCTQKFPCAVPRAEVHPDDISNALPPRVSAMDFEFSMLEPASKPAEIEKFKKYIEESVRH